MKGLDNGFEGWSSGQGGLKIGWVRCCCVGVGHKRLIVGCNAAGEMELVIPTAVDTVAVGAHKIEDGSLWAWAKAQLRYVGEPCLLEWHPLRYFYGSLKDHD